MTLASTLAGLKVLGSFSREMTDRSLQALIAVMTRKKKTHTSFKTARSLVVSRYDGSTAASKLVRLTEVFFRNESHRMMFSYSLSLPLESRQRRYMTLASTLAGLKVLGSFSSEMTDSSTVRTDCVGFQRSQGSSPDCGSSTGGCRMDMQRSPFCGRTGHGHTAAKVRMVCYRV